MRHRDKARTQLLDELAQLQARLAALEPTRAGPSALLGVGATERKRAETALREAKEFSSRLMNSMLDGVSVLDCDGVHVDVNEAFCRMTGFAREELLGTGMPHLYWPPEHQKAILATIERMRTGQMRNLDVVFMRKSGERFPAIVAPSAVRDASGNVVRYMATIKDITERQRAETVLREANAELERRVAERTAALTTSNDQLRAEIRHRRRVEASLARSERRFRNYFEQGLSGMVVSAFDKRWLEVNDRCCEILGYRREELLATTWAELTPPDDLAAELPQFDRLLAGEIEHYTLQKRFLRKDGATVHAVVAVRLFRDENGSPVHVICLIQDVSEQKRAEEALREERQTLKHLLQASDRERRLIAYDLHDGLAQYLAGAIMHFESCDALKASRPQQAEAMHATGIEMVRQAHAEARRLISGVRPPILDESGLLAAVDHLLHDPTTCPQQKLRWHASIETHRLAPIVENALYRIAQEALSNVCQHSRSETAKVLLVQRGNLLELAVMDRGIGFDPGAIPETCFGLRGIRERARLLGGTFVIQSRPGRGTCLRVTLPLEADLDA